MTIIYKEVFPYSDDILESICKKVKKKAHKRTKNKIEYYDIPVAFDIETSTIQQGGEHYSFMYIWQFGIGLDNINYILYGRTWEEFERLILKLGYMLELSNERKLVIYIQNAAYEFAFLARRFEWKKVFSIRPHKPLFFTLENGIEFRCSYLLSGMRLETIGKELTEYKAQKRVGDLDYSLVRSNQTPLPKKELNYCIDDIHVLLNYIRECMDNDGGITRIPYTKTGYARLNTKRRCFGSSHKKGSSARKYHGYKDLMQQLTMDYDAFIQAKYCFTGGFTHANAWWVDKLLFNIGARDISSSYPTQLCCNGFGMSAPTLCNDIRSEDDPKFKEHLEKDCCIFYMMLYDVECIFEPEQFLSASKVWKSEEVIENNGRVVSMKKGMVCITEIDYNIMKRVYKWKKSEIFGFRWMEKAYLPKDFIMSILSLYRDKTQLKGIKGKEALYGRKKSILNSVYG